MSNFGTFLTKVSQTHYDVNTTATGSVTIQQSARNDLRREGLEALKADLKALYVNEGACELVETKEGLVLVVENPDFTFSWEIKSTIKSLDFDPFIEANNYDEARAAKETKAAEKASNQAKREHDIAEKRAQKMAELEAKQELTK
jgi:hypothetical protein